MADNVSITAGSGTSIAADDVGGVYYQRIKLDIGGDGASSPITSGNPLPVSGTFWQATQPVSGTVTVGNASLAVTGTFWQATQPVSIAAAVTTTPGGNVAHDAVDSGNPLKIGGKANSSAPTTVAAGDRVDGWYDLWRQVISDLDPETGLTVGTTTLRDRLFAQRYTVLSDSIADGLATFWTQTTASGGTIAVTTGEGLIQTSASATGSAQMVGSVMAYHPGQVSWFNSAIRFGDTGSAGNIRRVGAFTVSGTTPQDGAYFELNGTTLNAVTVKGGVATATAQSSWTRNSAAPFTLDLDYHSFELRWTANRVDFYIDNVLRHTATGGATPITTTLNWPKAIQNINSSGATNRVIAVRNVGLGRFGQPDVTPVTINPEPTATYRGRVSTFRTPGRAGTTGQKIFAIHNATGSTRIVRVNKLVVDKYETVVKAVTVAPPVVRAHRFTAVPTNGTVLTKVAKDSSLSSNASVTVWGDASADGTGSGTTLTVTIPAGNCIAQEFASRLITAAGYEAADKMALLDGESIVLRPLEGIVVNLDYTLATQNPTTDMWVVTCDWWEATA